MGAIKDGTISGTLPEAKVFAVHYPGYPSSTSRAVETLGGPEAITKVRSSQSNCLELRFRPEDPYSHPAFGELHRCSGFLLKISKKKFSADQNAVASSIMSKCLSKDATSSVPVPCDSESKEVEERNLPEIESTSSNKDKEVQMHKKMLINLYVDIVARVSEAYQFNGMVDYQHVLAVHGDVARRKRRWVEVEPRFEKGGLIDIDLEDLMMLVPPIFSPKNIPEKLVLRPSGLLSSKKKQEAVVQNRWEMDIEPCIAIDFNIEEIPRKVNWEEHIPQGSAHWEWQTVLAKLFDERPIWHKHTLNQRLLEEGLHFGAHQLKRLLFRIAYYFATGPFRLFWIRKGYDPRKDSESRIYQTIDFRVPPPLRSFGNIDTTNELKDRWKEICAFQVFPSKNQTSFQVFDLVDDYIQEEIRKPIEQTTCT
ncbi:PREDICTED: general transcription factor 3C polypeptide 5, partial [Nelumbo nucifera]